MSNPFFSIIVPAHNSQEYIIKGLQSITSQSFKDYELIVVCDSCSDGTEDVAKFYGARTENVSFGRDGLTRDRGIELATGRYVLFMDDDDWFVHEYCFQQLYDAIMKHDEDDIDMLAFGCIFKTRGYLPPHPDRFFTPRISHVWTKAWRRELIGNARFGDAVFCSDTYFLRDMKSKVHLYDMLDMPIYYYNFKRPGSQTDLFCRGIIRESPVAEEE